MTTPNSTISEQLKTIFSNQCSCSECSSGVSPISYFYDLLNYSYKNFSIKSGGGYISLGSLGETVAPDFFKTRFKQEMENVPINCEALNEKLCQVRMAVETLWRYRVTGIGNNASSNASQTTLLESYLPAMHAMLLESMGLSLRELSLLRLMPEADKMKKASDMGIKYIKDSNGKDNFEYLNLDLANADDFDLTENNLETLFGIRETAQTRDLFSNGAKSLDTTNTLNRWVIENAILDENTDADGFVYLSLTYTSSGTIHTINVHRDSARTKLVATGTITTGSISGSVENTIRFYPAGNSGLSGYVLFKGFSSGTKTCRISVVPRVLSWKIRYMLDVWKKSDQEDNTRVPFIEPDLITLKDLQINKIDESTAASAIANIYTARAGQVSAKLNAIIDERGAPPDETVNLTAHIPTFSARAIKTDQNRSYILNGAPASAGPGDRIMIYDTSNVHLDNFVTSGVGVGGHVSALYETASDLTVNNQYLFVCNRSDATPLDTNIKVLNKTTLGLIGFFNPIQLITSSLLPSTLPNRINAGPENELYISYSSSTKILKFSNSKTFAHATDLLLQGAAVSIVNKYNFTYEVVAASNKLVKKDQQGNVVWETGKRDANNNFISGSEDGAFNNPTLVAFNFGYIFVKDTGNSRVQQFTEGGDFVKSFTTGAALNLGSIKEVRYDKLGNMYLLIASKHQIIKLNQYGIYELTIGKADGTSGSSDGQFNNPVSFCIDDEGFIYVADKGNKRIQTFNSKGEYIQQITSGGLLEDMEFISCTVDSNLKLDKLIVADNNGSNKNVRIFNNIGNNISSINTGTIKILTVCIDKYGRLVLGFDASTSTIKIYNLDAAFAVTPNISTPFKTINGSTDFKPADLTLDAQSNLIIANSLGKNITFIKNDAVAANIIQQKSWGIPTSNPANYSNGLYAPSSAVVSAAVNWIDGSVAVSTTNDLSKTRFPEILEVIVAPFTVVDLTNDTNNNPYALVGGTSSPKTLYKLDSNFQAIPVLTGLPPTTTGLFIDHEGNYIISMGDNTMELLNSSGAVMRTIDISEDHAVVLGLEFDQRGRLYLIHHYGPGTIGRGYSRVNLTMGIDYIFYNNLNNMTLSGLLNLKKMVDSESAGKTALGYYYMTPKELNFIVELLHLLLVTGDLSQKEWDQLYDIFVMIYKRKQLYKDWIKEENNLYAPGSMSNYDVFLSPFDFLEQTTAYENDLVLNSWRGDVKSRKNWRKLLSGRTDALNTLQNEFESNFGEVEEAGLKILRDKIIADSNTKIPVSVPATRKTDWLSERLFVDMAGNCCTRNPRVSYYIEVLQNIYNRIRTGSIIQLDPILDVRISDATFEKSWDTIGSYATWRSAMFVNFYPENLLLPSLRNEKTRFFATLAESVSSGERFNPDQACVIAKKYSDYLRDISFLTPSTSLCTKIGLNSNGQTAVDKAVKQDVIMHFAISRSRKVYYAISNLSKAPEQRTAEWIQLEQLKDIDYILGAVELFDEKDRQNKIVLLVKRSIEENLAEIAMLVYKTEDGIWGDEAESLDMEHNLSKEKYPHILVDALKLPFDRGGFHAILEESPVAGFSYKDRLDWDSFNTGGYPKVPAIALNIWWSTVIFICYLDFKNKKLVSRTGPVFIRGKQKSDGTYEGPEAINNPVDLNFIPQALVRLPVPSGIGDPNVRYALIGVDRKLDWKSSRPTVFYLNNQGTRLGSHRTSTESFVEFSGYWFDKDANQLHFFWNNTQSFTSNYLNASGDFVKDFFINNQTGFVRSLTNAPAVNRNTVVSMTSDGQVRLAVPTFSGSGTSRKLSIVSNLMAISATTMSAPFIVNPNIGKPDLLRLINGTRDALRSSRNNTLISKTYIAEAFYFMPMILAAQLQKKGYYKEALDWYRLLYDYTMAINSRKIYHGLVLEEKTEVNIDRPENWLSDPFNPHSLALSRNNAYTKYTVSSIVRCMLEYADNEFTKDTIESVGLARMVYQQAKTLIYESGILGSNLDSQCKAKIDYIDTFDTHASFTGNNAIWLEQWKTIKAKLHLVTSLKNLQALCNPTGGTPPGFIPTTLGTGSTTKVKLSKINEKIDQYISQSVTIWSLSSIVGANRETRKQVHKQLLRDLETAARLRSQVVALAASKAQAFTQVTGIAPAAMRAGVSIVADSSVSLVVPIRMEILRQPPVSVSVSISRVVSGVISL